MAKALTRARIWKLGGAIAAVLISFDIVTYFMAEGLWFESLGYSQAFWLRLQAQLGLGLMGLVGSFGFALANLLRARQLSVDDNCILPNPSNRQVGLGLTRLLPLTVGLTLLVLLVLLYHGQLAATRWHTQDMGAALPTLPLWLNFRTGWQITQQVMALPWLGAVLLGGSVIFLIYPLLVGYLSTIVLSLSFGLVLSSQWTRVLPALDPTPFGIGDPLFNNDISFYIFRLPILELIEFWMSGLLLFTLALVTLVYLLAGNSLSQGRFLGFSLPQRRHLFGLLGGLLLTTALDNWIARYELLYSPRGVTVGASYTDVAVSLPVNTGLSMLALLLAVILLWRTLFWHTTFRGVVEWLVMIGRAQYAYVPKVPVRPRGSRLPLGIVFGYVAVSILGATLVPSIVQRLVVQPNELERETPFIERTIAFTRQAFNLTDIQDEIFTPEGNLTAQELFQNDLTVRNIRVWDTRPLLESNRQLQQIRSYYEFVDADVDRYTIRQDDGTSERRQVIISARELNTERLDEIAQTWVNRHLSYTHGYGFTMSPVNTAGIGGLPTYFIKDIAHVPSDPAVARSIPVGEPRIYFGELTNDYVMTSTQVQELDYPSGSDNVYTTYAGQGGIAIGDPWRRLLFAKHLGDWQMLFTNNFTPQTQLLFRRNIQDRVKHIAPFLQFDQDPYLVIANVPSAPAHEQNKLYWLVDAYTTSDRYPYAAPGNNDFNYIRNSVKAVVNAYDGTVDFYVADAKDPIIQTWDSLFPQMFHPLAEMPAELAAHIRYPQDYSLVQSDQLLTYHMTDPRVFYNREDQWRAPTEIYANEQQVVEPYYLIMKLPDTESEEFILLRPFTPRQRNNLIAWLAARSDGENYGRILLYRFPKQELVFGPEQIEARINQDPEISQRISLWDTQGSRANQGNLLVIPIEDSLLYVEPLYLEAEQNRLPILARVIVAYRNRIAMAETLEQSLSAIFSTRKSNSPAIIRDLESGSTGNADQIDQLLLPNNSTPDSNENIEAGSVEAGSVEAGSVEAGSVDTSE
ncbi:MAG: UPF0182 family protein [Cyanobacteria bacterium P01_A01_bin.105]